MVFEFGAKLDFCLDSEDYGMGCITIKLEARQGTAIVLAVFVTNWFGFRGGSWVLFCICSDSGMAVAGAGYGSCLIEDVTNDRWKRRKYLYDCR